MLEIKMKENDYNLLAITIQNEILKSLAGERPCKHCNCDEYDFRSTWVNVRNLKKYHNVKKNRSYVPGFILTCKECSAVRVMRVDTVRPQIEYME